MMGNLSYSAKGAQSAPSNPHQSQKHRKTSRGINEHLVVERMFNHQMVMEHQPSDVQPSREWPWSIKWSKVSVFV
jgi:hypothetical protein